MLCPSCLCRLLEPLASGAPLLSTSTGEVKNRGQGSPRTSRANTGRSLSSHASCHAPWRQGPRGPCGIPWGGCAASRRKLSPREEHLGSCHSRVVTKRTALCVTYVYLWVGFLEAAPLSSCRRVRWASTLSLLPQSLAHRRGVRPVGFAICQACVSLFRVSLKDLFQFCLMACLYFLLIFLLGC